MKGWGLKVQINRTYFYVCSWPFRWELYSGLHSPREFGFGFWITKDVWA